MEQISIKQPTLLHQDWLRRLDFYHFELFMLQEQLDEIAEETTDADVLEKAGYFKSRMIIRKNHIEKLRVIIRENDIRLTQEMMCEDTIDNTLKIFDTLNNECVALQESVNALRRDFDLFVAQCA
ncbi:hypothetical protein AAFN85_16705 [Mucilaginibacter sp. CAU 1740]|uniref:hypothetical protein n=1 Tax=Mucilaginibacter sp. CAU 1740 TaxID=3140365 RepID=UPI00325BB661